MYKDDPNQPKKPVVIKTDDNKKVAELENKLRRLTEQFGKMQYEIDRLTRLVKRQGSEISSLINRVR